MALNEDIIYKRLKQVKIAQDSVETTSSWILHHVKYISSISRVWFDVFLIASDELKISLIYVMNDVCQKSRKAPKDQFLKISSNFFYHLRYAISLSNNKVKEKIRRVVAILKERQIFSSNKIDELNLILDGKLTKEFPIDKIANEDTGQEIIDDAKKIKKDYDKYYELVQKYLGEEGIYKAFRKREHDKDKSREPKRPKVSSRDADEAMVLVNVIEKGVNEVSMQAESSSIGNSNILKNNKADTFLKTLRETKDVLERSNQITIIAQKVQQAAAAEVAIKEGKNGLLNRKTLGLEHSTAPVTLKDLSEIDNVNYDSWKHIKSERIQQLKKKLSSEVKNGDGEKYSPTKTNHDSIIKPPLEADSLAIKQISVNESEEAKMLLNSIPLPKDTILQTAVLPSNPPPLQISPTRSSLLPPPLTMTMNYDDDVAPPGVDIIPHPPPLQIPPSHQTYDPTLSAYSPTTPSGYYHSIIYPNTTTPRMMSSPPPPHGYYPPPPSTSPHNVYNNNNFNFRGPPRFPTRPSNSSAYYDQSYYK